MNEDMTITDSVEIVLTRGQQGPTPDVRAAVRAGVLRYIELRRQQPRRPRRTWFIDEARDDAALALWDAEQVKR